MFSQLIYHLEKELLWKTPERALNVYRRLPRSLFEHYRLANLKRTLELVREKSIYYSRIFDKHPFEIQSVKSIEDLFFIFTNQRDLAEHPPSDFLCNRPDTAFESTGTSSKTAKKIFFSQREIEDAGRVGAAGLWKLGLRPQDRVASAFDYSFWVSGPTLKASVHTLGAFHVEAGRLTPEDFYDRVKPYRCNVIVADPGWLVRLSEVADRRGAWTMKFMVAGGENLSESSRQYIERVWSTDVYLSYGQTEAFGMIGLECSAKNGYAINDCDLWAEIPMADTEGYGELVYTTLRRSVMPLIRYRSGDVTRILSDPCTCGEPRCIRLDKLKGRMDDMVITSVGNITPWMLERVLNEASLPIPDWQLHVQQADRRDVITFRAEAPSLYLEKDVYRKIIEKMKTEMPIALQGIQEGLAEFKVKMYKPGELKRGRKIKRILDERDFRNVNQTAQIKERPPSATTV